MINIILNNLRSKVKFWVIVKHKDTNFIDGYLHANFDVINQSEYKELLKYSKTLTK